MSRIWRHSNGWHESLSNGATTNGRNRAHTEDSLGKSRMNIIRSNGSGNARLPSNESHRRGTPPSFYTYGHDEFGMATDHHDPFGRNDLYSTIGSQFEDTKYKRKDEDREVEMKDSKENIDNSKKMNAVEEFCQMTGFDGFKHVGNNTFSTMKRIFWVVVVIAAGIGLGYQFFKSTVKYSQYPVNTKYSVADKEYLDFPAITLCNVNMFRLDNTLKLYGGYDEFLYSGLPQLRQLFPQMGVTYEPNINVPIDEHYPGMVDLKDFIRFNAHRLEDMLVKCTFNGDPCNADNFTSSITNYGVCFTYNGNDTPIQATNQAGQRKGLSMILNVQHKLYVAAPRESAGFKVLAHSRDEIPNMDDHGKELEPGTHVAFGLSITKLEKLDSPYGKCVSNTSYTQDKCLRSCQSAFVSKHCGCRTYYMSGNAPYCSPIQLVDCAHEKLDYFNAEKEDICNCDLPCKRTLYHASLSQSLFPSYSVPSILLSTNNWHFPALAFGEVVTLASFTELEKVFGEGLQSLQSEFYTATNADGKTLVSLTSEDIVNDVVTLIVENIYIFIPYDIFDAMGDTLFYDVFAETLLPEKYARDIGLGSDFYLEQIQLSYNMYVHSGTLRQLLQIGLYNRTDDPVDEAFVDQIYDEFKFEEGFVDAFNLTYNAVYTSMKNTAINDVVPNADFTEITAGFMRDNILHVDIFYEELRITTIKDQAGYEFFQYLCDVGGALGLFFGASLVSFLESLDFCCSRKSRKQ